MEHDDPRGEFIAVQCKLGGTISGVTGDGWVDEADEKPESYKELQERERQLLKKWGRHWMAPYNDVLRRVAWRRGFVADAEVDALAFVENLALLARVPLETVSLTGYRPKALNKMLAATPHPTIRKIEFYNRIAERTAAVLASPVFAGARELSLSYNDLSSVATMRVLKQAALPKLETLDLSSTHLSDAAVMELSGATFWSQLTDLDLRGNYDLTPTIIEAIARATSLTALIVGCDFDDAGAQRLIERAPASLQYLFIDTEGLSKKTAAALKRRFPGEWE
jgi:hypothetical protein